MSDKKLNAIKEIEARINSVRKECTEYEFGDSEEFFDKLNRIDNLLFDINDFINDLKDE